MATIENHLKTGGEQIEYKNKLSGSGMLEVSRQCGEVFQEMKIRRKHRYVIYEIGEDEIRVKETGDRKKTFSDLKAILPYTDCRFAIYDHEYKTADGRPASKLWFITWLPNNSTPYAKMAYTSAKAKLRDTIPGVFDIAATNTDEIEVTLGLKVEDDEDDEFDD